MQRMDLSSSKLTILYYYCCKANSNTNFRSLAALSTNENICNNRGNECFVRPLFQFSYTNYKVFYIFREVQVQWCNWLARSVVLHLCRENNSNSQGVIKYISMNLRNPIFIHTHVYYPITFIKSLADYLNTSQPFSNSGMLLMPRSQPFI